MKFHYVLKSARDILKVPVTNFKKPKSARDILKVPVTNFKKPKSARDMCPWHLCPWHFQSARDNFQKSARDIEKVPVTNFKNKMSRAQKNVTGKKKHWL